MEKLVEIRCFTCSELARIITPEGIPYCNTMEFGGCYPDDLLYEEIITPPKAITKPQEDIS